MILAVAAVLHYAAEQGTDEAEPASRAIYEAVMEAAAAGVRTNDLGGHAGTTEFTDEVITARELKPGSTHQAWRRRATPVPAKEERWKPDRSRKRRS